MGGMSGRSTIDPSQFIEVAYPLLERLDAQGLISKINQNWTLSQVAALLESEHTDARTVAALAVSLIGTSHCLDRLVSQLRDPDATTRQMAEHAMWCIWFRNGKTPAANQLMTRGAQKFAAKDVAGAIELFSQAIELDDGFAEAYNQRAMAYFVLEEFEQSRADCERTVALMPMHFGAWAGLGHCLLNLGRHVEALSCYKKAMDINPHLDCVGEIIAELSELADEVA
jgi:tetratricopeptide (TPR) repeat protein